MIIEDLQPLYDKYDNELKPLIAQYESHAEKFVPHLLCNMPRLFDAIAQYSEYKWSRENEKADGEFKEAETQLDSAIDNALDFNNKYQIEQLKLFEKRFSNEVLQTLNRGQFYGEFKKLKKCAQQSKISNKLETHEYLNKLETLINTVDVDLLVSSVLIDNRKTFWLKIVITVLISLGTNFLIMKIL